MDEKIVVTHHVERPLDPICQQTILPGGAMGFIRAMDRGNTPVRCCLQAGHVGPHLAHYQPFPGFADEVVTWEDQ